MLRYCGVIVQVMLRARLGRLDGGADLLQQLAVSLQPIALEVAQDEVQLRLGRVAAHLIDMNETPGGRSVVSGVSVTCGSVIDDLRRQVQRVDQHVLRLTRVDRHALDRDHRFVGRKGLVDDLAKLPRHRACRRRRPADRPADWRARRGRSPRPA